MGGSLVIVMSGKDEIDKFVEGIDMNPPLPHAAIDEAIKFINGRPIMDEIKELARHIGERLKKDLSASEIDTLVECMNSACELSPHPLAFAIEQYSTALYRVLDTGAIKTIDEITTPIIIDYLYKAGSYGNVEIEPDGRPYYGI